MVIQANASKCPGCGHRWDAHGRDGCNHRSFGVSCLCRRKNPDIEAEERLAGALWRRFAYGEDR